MIERVANPILKSQDYDACKSCNLQLKNEEENIFSEKDFAQEDDTSKENQFLEDETLEVSSEGGFFRKIISKIIGMFKKREPAKIEYPVQTAYNGEIESTKQHTTGDCWLLSGVNAISYTDEGKKLIKESLEYTGDSVIVHFGGLGDYSVRKEEINNVRKRQSAGENIYSTGDDDMLAYELATEKVFSDLLERDFMFQNAPSEYEDGYDITQDVANGDGAIWGGQITQFMYLLTGKKTQIISNKNDIEKELENFDATNIALGVGVRKPVKVRDINNRKVSLYGPHAYAVKSTDENTVTITNPWDSSKDIVLSKETFIKNVESLAKCDLKGNNANYVRFPDEIDEYGNKTYKNKAPSEITYTSSTGDEIDCREIVDTYSKDGMSKESTYFDKNGNKLKVLQTKQASNGLPYMYKVADYTQNGTKAYARVFDENGNTKSYELYDYDLDGNLEETICVKSPAVYSNILNRGLFDYKQFSLDEIDLIGNFNDSDWQKTKFILRSNPNASFENIIRYLDT